MASTLKRIHVYLTGEELELVDKFKNKWESRSEMLRIALDSLVQERQRAQDANKAASQPSTG